MAKFSSENLKVGDKVLLKNKRGEAWNLEGAMDKYIGKIVTIDDLNYGGGFSIKEDDRDNRPLKWEFSYEDIERIVNDFKLSDLQFADIITLRSGERYVYADDVMRGEKLDYNSDGNTISCWYNDDLTQNEGDRSEDIVKVERNGQVIYERQEAIEMTVEEICEKLGYEVKIVKGDN